MRKNRILWFSITPSLYNSMKDHVYQGWIESLERICTSYNDFDLGIAFISPDKGAIKQIRSNVTYYPIYIRKNLRQRITSLYTYKYEDQSTINECLRVIKDYKPDLIQIFGSEWCFGLLREYTDIPIIIHMQGFWPEYRNSIYPPGFSKLNDFLLKWYKPTSIIRKIFLDKKSKERVLREERILRENNFYMGRTKWDKAITSFYNDNSVYFFCSEALRPAFANEIRRWQCNHSDVPTFITVGGGHTLKGFDLILKTALLLKQNVNLNFKWLLCGPGHNEMKLFERMTNIKYKDVNVVPLGSCTAEVVKERMLESVLYIHPSYIDNSPNAVCEAQYLGLPIIATNVGGTSSLFSSDYPLEMLVSPNDPYYLASKIKLALKNDSLLRRMSESNYKIAKERHSDEHIYESLIYAYRHVLKDSFTEK